MKITFFRLKGYVKVLNGMGLDEIAIPFETFKNRIILIQGENGCSKSTLISALSPSPDTSDSFRTDIFVDYNGNRQIIEHPAEKEIHYEDIDEFGITNHYRILIQSIVDESRTKRTTKAFISKNGEELNPNGNVSSFKEIRDNILGIDPIYLDLSSISSENRGIVDMIPSERRKYMSAYIGSLDTYNNIFKTISRKVSVLKSYMNTLNSKIYEIGNEHELRLKLSQLEKELEYLTIKRDGIIKKISEAETIIKMKDPDDKVRSLYISISEQIQSINNSIRKNSELLDKGYDDLKISKKVFNLENLYSDTKNTIEMYKEKLLGYASDINTKIQLNEATAKSLDNDRAILSKLNSDRIQNNIKESVVKLQQELNDYQEYISKDDIKFLESVSIDELLELRITLNEFIAEIISAEDMYDKGTYDKAVAIAARKQFKDDLTEKIDSMKSEISDIRVSIVETESIKKDLEQKVSMVDNFNNTRPKSCTIDSCPYISKYVELMNNTNLKQDLDSAITILDELRLRKIELEKSLDELIKINDIIKRLNFAMTTIFVKKSIISKIDSLKDLLDYESIKQKLINMNRFPEFATVSDIIEKAYSYINMNSIREQLNYLKGDLSLYEENKEIIDSITKSIEENEKIYNAREDEIAILSKDSTFIKNILVELNNRLERIADLIRVSNSNVELLTQKQLLKEQFDSIKDTIKVVESKLQDLRTLKLDLQKIDKDITPIQNNINRLKYNLTNILDYQNELKESSDKYEKMVFVRNACSPGNGMGIQSEYIKRYMNDIIIDCNKMLSYMFNGSIQLDVPVINEKQFSIPFIGPNGIVVPDVSNGSTAQKCMIGLVFACVAMMKSSQKYNIPRFDEIDGGLDQNNRITFINVLNQILDFMGSDQCIICSHNNEFDTQNTTRIRCSRMGIKIEE